jgi:lipid II:glycine glycyltransferase (peptidoglycan interpeptide bridge formation enzyme)
MASTAERLGIVETKVVNLDSKMDELKIDVKEMHDCLDNTRDMLADKLKEMSEASNKQHSELARKISDMEKLKDRWTFTVAGVLVAVGWVSAHGTDIIRLLAN